MFLVVRGVQYGERKFTQWWTQQRPPSETLGALEMSPTAESRQQSSSAGPDSIRRPVRRTEENRVLSEAWGEPAATSLQHSLTEKKAARIYRWKIVIGLLLPSALQALDVTIIASALPFIASDFDDLSQVGWITSAFNLCSAAFIPAFGQLADLFGRHNVLQSCLVLILVGSALCAGAKALFMLLLGRALQGIACAGILVLIRVILADKVSLRENADNTSLYTLISGVAYGVGPVIGGYLTDITWRWCFIINVPIGFVAIITVFFILKSELLGPKQPPEPVSSDQILLHSISTFVGKMAQIDIGGQFIFLTGAVLLILAITWGGATYPWDSPAVLIPLVFGSFIICMFPAYEYFLLPGKWLARRLPRQMAMIPFHMLATRNLGILCYINFATGMAMYGVLYFVGIYFTLVENFSASKSGTRILYYLPGLGVGAYLAMYFCNTRPRQTFLPLFLGTIVEATGMTVLTWALHDNHIATIYGMMALTGVGTGMRFMPGTLHGVGFFPDAIAPVVSLLEFMITFGGTLVLPLMNSVFNNKMAGSEVTYSTGTTTNLGSISGLSTDARAQIRDDAKRATVWAYVAVLPFMWLAVIIAAGLGNVNLEGEVKEPASFHTHRDEQIVESFYLNHLRRRFSGF
ncbi:MAG: hypothetical protein M1818_002274 [Claussenomyces sp. TS43310]|nr:MAG: hypothetical protein M1818_002274 [Claussenomyces sp. TS43310]